jgi:hypothetical protein
MLPSVSTFRVYPGQLGSTATSDTGCDFRSELATDSVLVNFSTVAAE